MFESGRDSKGNKLSRFGYAKGKDGGLADMNLELVFQFQKNNIHGYIAKSLNFDTEGGDIVVAFRGTVQLADFETNFHGTLTPFEPLWDRDNAGAYPCLQGTICCSCEESAAQKRDRLRDKPRGRIHVGFYNAFLGVRQQIQTTLEILLNKVVPTGKNIRLVVTGHSLGGALATVCTAWLMQWFRYEFPGGLPEKLRLLSITFGQPKVGDDDFVRNVDHDEWTNWGKDGNGNNVNAKLKTYRLFTPLDPVPTTPPVDLGFRHCYAMTMIKAGELFFLPQSFANKVDTTTQGIKRAIDQGMNILHFHDLFNYLEAVMHFADLNRGSKGMDEVFGKVDYQAVVREADFLEKF